MFQTTNQIRFTHLKMWPVIDGKCYHIWHTDPDPMGDATPKTFKSGIFRDGLIHDDLLEDEPPWCLGDSPVL